MNWDRAQGNWRQLSGWLRQRWAELTGDPLGVRAGGREILAGKLQYAYGIGRDQARRQADDWRESMQDAASDNDGAPRQMDARQ